MYLNIDYNDTLDEMEPDCLAQPGIECIPSVKSSRELRRMD